MADRDLSAYREQHEAIRREFKKQAPNWGKNEIPPQLQWVVERLDLQPHAEVLDVAAGNGLLSRAIAPHVKRVVALDITPEMLAQGRDETNRAGITNISFEQGAAEDLHYPTDSFDVVATRFSVHHFQFPEAVLREMWRVCRRAGKIVVIDLVSSEDKALAAQHNHLERLRDASHTQALSATDLKRLLESVGVKITNHYSLEVENNLNDWLDFTRTPYAERQQVIEAMHRELKGDEITGMRPFLHENKLMFRHTWAIVVGEKREAAA